MRRIKVISLIVIVIFASFFLTKLSDPDEIVPMFPPLTIEAVSAPSFGGFIPPPGDSVIGVQAGSESRTYPVSLVEWHGAVNDVVSGDPIVVTYSFLSDSAAVYSRVLDERVLTFSVQKGVYRNNLLMRDDETQSIWSQIDGRAIKGPLSGKVLTRVPSVRTDWSNWEALHSSALVMEPPTDVQYGLHPYGDYRENEQILFPYRFEDPVLGPKDPVLGINLNGSYSAYPLFHLANERIVTDEIGSTKVVIAYAYGAPFVYEAGNWSFTYVSGSTMEDQYSNRWNMTTGLSDDGNHTLVSLQASSIVCYWFAWLNFHSDTYLFGDDPRQVTERSWIIPALPWILGLLICLSIVSLDRYMERRMRSSASLPKWIPFRRSILLAFLAVLVFSIILFDSLGNLKVVNTAVEILFAAGFLILGIIMVTEWHYLRGYEAVKIPIDMSGLGETLRTVLDLEDIRSKELEPTKLGFMRIDGGHSLEEPEVDILFSGNWLLTGSPDGYSSEDIAKTKRIVQMSMTPPLEELL
ncbi:MAG: DUF3179 domain-containing (seleno)protein [Thermoplasmata archaeon]